MAPSVRRAESKHLLFPISESCHSVLHVCLCKKEGFTSAAPKKVELGDLKLGMRCVSWSGRQAYRLQFKNRQHRKELVRRVTVGLLN